MKGVICMAFDACMLACMASEINATGAGGRIEKIYQPERDEIIFQMRTTSGGKRILINGGVNNPRIHFTSVAKENPAQAPPVIEYLSHALCFLAKQYTLPRPIAVPI